MKQAKIFYSYAHEDTELKNELEKHLANLRNQKLITTWERRNIDAGSDWTRETNANLNIADIILLLISPDFMHSEYCNSFEMKRALERHENKTAKVIPIILRPVDYDGAPFCHLQVLPTNAVPVSDRKWHTLDEAFVDITKSLNIIVLQVISGMFVQDGIDLLRREKYQESLEAFKEAIRFYPQNAYAHYGKGEALLKSAIKSNRLKEIYKYERALDAFNISLQLDPNNNLALLGKANATFLCSPWKKGKEAINIYGQVLMNDPDNEEAHLGIANVHRRHSEYDKALQFCDKAIEVAPIPNWDSHVLRARLLDNMGKHKEALEAFEMIYEAFPGMQKNFDDVANIQFNLGNYDEAIINYDSALKFLEKDATNRTELYIKKGKAYQCKEDFEKALEAFEQAIKTDPDSFEAHEKKGETLQKLSEAAYEEARLLNPF